MEGKEEPRVISPIVTEVFITAVGVTVRADHYWPYGTCTSPYGMFDKSRVRDGIPLKLDTTACSSLNTVHSRKI